MNFPFARSRFEKSTASTLAQRGIPAAVPSTRMHRGDLEIPLRTDVSVVIRQCRAIRNSDHTALATMLCEGRYVWGAIVYEEREGSELKGWVECFHVSELDRLVEHLLALRAALAEPVLTGGAV